MQTLPLLGCLKFVGFTLTVEMTVSYNNNAVLVLTWY